MKNCTIIVLMILMISGYGLAKPKMDPQMQEKLTQELKEMSEHCVLVMDNIPSSLLCFCQIHAKDAGESGLMWEEFKGLKLLKSMKTKVKVTFAIKRTFGDCLKCDTTLKAGELIRLLMVTPQKGGFRITISAAKGNSYPSKEMETYIQRYRIDGVISEVKKSRPLVKEAYRTTTMDFMFHKNRHANTPENIEFIRNTFSRVFKFFKSKEETMIYIDKEFLDYTVEIGMTPNQVVEKIGPPKNKRQSESRLIYEYDLCNISFEENKVVDVEFL